MKTSARNHYSGVVRAVRAGAVNDEIEIEASDGFTIVAVVTSDSSKALGLKAGVAAFALIKSSSIILMTDCADVRLSARNQLAGKIARVAKGAVNSEVVLSLPGGGQVVVIITNESAQKLALVDGGAATAIFKASDVIVGVKS